MGAGRRADARRLPAHPADARLDPGAAVGLALLGDRRRPVPARLLRRQRSRFGRHRRAGISGIGPRRTRRRLRPDTRLRPARRALSARHRLSSGSDPQSHLRRLVPRRVLRRRRRQAVPGMGDRRSRLLRRAARRRRPSHRRPGQGDRLDKPFDHPRRGQDAPRVGRDPDARRGVAERRNVRQRQAALSRPLAAGARAGPRLAGRQVPLPAGPEGRAHRGPDHGLRHRRRRRAPLVRRRRPRRAQLRQPRLRPGRRRAPLRPDRHQGRDGEVAGRGRHRDHLRRLARRDRRRAAGQLRRLVRRLGGPVADEVRRPAPPGVRLVRLHHVLRHRRQEVRPRRRARRARAPGARVPGPHLLADHDLRGGPRRHRQRLSRRRLLQRRLRVDATRQGRLHQAVRQLAPLLHGRHLGGCARAVGDRRRPRRPAGLRPRRPGPHRHPEA